ncbi:DNA adenine methylase [Paenibacillus sp. NAIST15-1]|uniref:DNA adenine methylase n=1 Tax=Paenibacillus sp. NAIST15-1 TaxID=1605994 RepID=UPI000933C3E9|nr:DNA adenine methylase [Paenibacillus sp. NAIST15-1]
MNSPIKWVGGKSRMVKKMIPLIPNHKGYVEVFGGAAYLLFGKDRSNWEIVNDLDNGLMNFWFVVKNAKEEFLNSFKYTLISRETFNDYKKKWKTGNIHDSIERAHVFYYLVNAGFGADMKNPVFGTKKDKFPLQLDKIHRDIDEAYERIKTVVIEQLDFRKCIEKYDSDDTFFYIDSPYRNTKEYAVGKFTDNDYEDLYRICKNCKGKWLYTINNDEYIRDLFKEFNIINHEVYYSVCKTNSGRQEFKELIITNYDITE